MDHFTPYKFRFLKMLYTPEDSPSCGRPVVQQDVQAGSSSKALLEQAAFNEGGQ
jgi:hypothetical protein